MNKREMVAKLAKATGLTKAKASEVIDVIFDPRPGRGIIGVELDAGRKVTIPGFGTFGTRTRAARTGTNPVTGTEIRIPQKSQTYFKPGKSLKERIEAGPVRPPPPPPGQKE